MAQSRQPRVSYCYWASVTVCLGQIRMGLFRLFKFTDLQPKLGPVSALYQADCHFYYGIQFRKQKSQSPAHGRYITGPCFTCTTANPSGSKKTRVRHSIGPLLCRTQVLAARVWARIGRQVYTGVIIPVMACSWQPIYGKFLAMLGQCWAVSNFALGIAYWFESIISMLLTEML